MKEGNQLLEITALWKHESKDGKVFLKGPFGNSDILILENKYKKEDKHPDYRMFVVPKRKKDEQGSSNEGGPA